MSALFPTYNRWELNITSGKGTKVIDGNGKEYLDFTSGIAVCNLGHRQPTVQQALEEQLNKVWHVSNLFQVDGQETVAKMLTEHSSGDLVFFCNSGAEANEAAIKLVRKHTQKQKIITFEKSFHGRTFATMSATGQEKIHNGFGPLLQTFIYVPYNDEKALEEVMDNNVAAIMLEVVQGEGGLVPGEKSFLKKAETLARKYDALLVIDEVQTGIGRTGKPFAYQHFDLSPDIITTAKGLGSGFPVAAMIGKDFLKDSFSAGVHGSTFGGNPLAMAAAKATLEIVFHKDFLEEVVEKGHYFEEQLTSTLNGMSWVKDIRLKGLMIGIECESDVTHVISRLRKNGLLVLNARSNVIRLLPPLTVTKEEMNQAIKLLQFEIKDYCPIVN